MEINNIEQLSNNELVKKFKEATRHGKPPKPLLDEMKKHPVISFLNPIRNTEGIAAAVRAAIEKIEKSKV